jgi:hypothetical protein
VKERVCEIENGKEVNQMENNYEAPELTLVGETSEVVMGIASFGGDSNGHLAAPDFEFEED